MDQLGCPELDDVDPASITAEHLLYAEDRVKYRKQLLRDEYESWLRRLAENWTRKKKRVADLMKSRSARKAERAAKNRAAREKIDLQLDKIEIDEFYRKLKLENHLRNKDAKLAANLANLKRTRLAEKRNRDVARYCKLYNNQKYRIENDMRALIRKCMRNAEGDEVSSTENAGAEVEHANFGDNSNTPETVPADGGPSYADGYDEFGHMFIERIQRFKTNENACEQGVSFLGENRSVWDSVTQCLAAKRSSAITESVSETIIIADDDPTKQSVVAFSLAKDVMLQQILFKDVATDMDYNWSDSSVIKMMKEAKGLLDPYATSAEIMHLTRCIMEDKAEVITNVNHVVRSLVERSVFEFTKLRIAKAVFVSARKWTDRLQHVNDGGLIPKNLIKFKNKVEVTSVVRNILVDDEMYRRFDKPLDDDRDYVALVAETAAERMRRVTGHNDETSSYAPPTRPFPMARRDELLEVTDQTIVSYLNMANGVIAVFVSTSRPDKFAEARYRTSKITTMMAYRIGRKIAKLMFGMFTSEARRVYNVEKAYSLCRTLVTNRAPRVVYDYDKRANKPKKVDVDLCYFNRLLDTLNPRKRESSSGRRLLDV